MNRMPQLAIAYLLLALTGNAQAQQTPTNPDYDTVRFARVAFMGEVAAYIAEDQGYFADEKLNMVVKQNAAGKESLKDLFEGRVDIITTAETPIVYAAFKRDDFYIIAGVAHSETMAGAIARRDSGINSPAEIKGKRIALFEGTASDYLLDQYLISNDLSYEDIQRIDMKPKIMVDELVQGRVDGIFGWEPHIKNASAQLGDNAYLLPTVGLKTMDWVIVVSKSYAEQNPQVLVKFLRAIDRANSFIRGNNAQAAAIFSRRSGISQDLVKALWGDFSFELYLSEALLINMEDQARWAITTGRVAAREIPNYLQRIDFNALQQLRPQAISLIK